MADSYLRIREKENAKEWRMDDAAAKGHIYSHFNENVEDDSDSGRDATPHPQQLPRLRATQGNQLKKLNSFATPRRPPHHKKIILLGGKRDNAAKRAFRNGQRPGGIFDLGKPFRDVSPSFARVTLAIEEIGVRLNSFILPPRSLGETKLQIWGDERQVHLTKNDLRLWVFREDSRKKIGEKCFAKINSSISDRYLRDEAKAKRDAQRQIYQQAPRKDQYFQWNNYFLWPDDEVRATELLGPSCEAFDPLRRDLKVYIVFDEKRSMFKVYSQSKPENIDKAVQRIRNTAKEYSVRDERKITLLFVQPPIPTSHREGIRIVPGPLLGIDQTPSNMPELTGKKLEDHQITAWIEKSTQMTFKNRSRSYAAIRSTIGRLPHYRGRIRMRVRLGTFTLVKFQWPPGLPSVTLNQFLADIQSAGTKGMVIRDLRLPSAASNIVQRCHSASDIFVPYGTMEESLVNVESQYTVMFYLRHPDKLEQVIQLEVEFGKTGAAEDSIEPMQCVWKRSGKPDAAAQGSLLELYNVRLPR